ncbi:PepSY domain-containing protein [Shewanella maritima]|uniref:PepSY domain-containing protein n=1 Tax=Shewanella maritima TaxID=2520507 RepID=UPI0037355290
MRMQKLTRTVRIIHYWLGVIVGLQLLIWLGTGLYFNLTPYEQLKGLNQQQALPTSITEQFNPNRLLPLTEILQQFDSVEKVSMTAMLGQPIYLLDTQVTRYPHDCQQQTLVNAYSGKPVSIDAQMATQLAVQTYTSDAKVISTQQLHPPIDAWPKQCNGLWQITVQDELNTRIYINAVNGQLVGHKNDQTDVADLMFKLHFMDYLHQGSFNNPFSWVFGLMALLLSLSGVYWVVESLAKKRYRFS